MNPLAIAGAGMDFVGQLGKLGLGFAQLAVGSRMNPQRPTYNIPREVKEQLALNQANLNARMAGATQAERNIAQQASNMVGTARRGSTSSSQLLSMASASQGQANRGFTGLATAEAQDRQRRLSNLNQSQAMMAGYRDKAWKLNEFDPYQDEARTKAALLQGGFHNIYGATTDMGTGLAQVGTAMDIPMGGGGGTTYQPSDRMDISGMAHETFHAGRTPQGGMPSFGGPQMPTSQGAWGWNAAQQFASMRPPYQGTQYYQGLQQTAGYGPGLNFHQGMNY
jgi:hypothetical protein